MFLKKKNELLFKSIIIIRNEGKGMNKKVDVSPIRYFNDTVRLLGEGGLLLVSGNEKKANVMTIGWGLPGRLWAKPFFLVAVRPSRYTFQFIEDTGSFTVNVPTEDMKEILNYCGTVSGREHDKFKEKGLTLLPGRKVSSPVIAECAVHYECKVAFKTKVVPVSLPSEVLSTFYPRGDYHTLYFGEVLACYADEDAENKL